MRDLAANRRRSGMFSRACLVACSVPLLAAASPAQAQDLFGFFRLLFQPPPPTPMYRPQYGPAPRFDRSILRRPKIVRAEPQTKPPLKPKPPGEIANPVPALLADSTLRRGDMVMFPDGLRVFVGQAHAQHALADFQPVSGASSALSPAARKVAARLRPGWNGAWSADAAGATRMTAVRDVDTTGSVTERRR
jgi:hypothetical protein